MHKYSIVLVCFFNIIALTAMNLHFPNLEYEFQDNSAFSRMIYRWGTNPHNPNSAYKTIMKNDSGDIVYASTILHRDPEFVFNQVETYNCMNILSNH